MKNHYPNMTRNKYGNRKTYCLSKHKHDSKKEAGHCNVLLAMEQSGEIISYENQPRYELQPMFRNPHTGKAVRAITYTADFVVYHNGMTEIIDVKGVQTDAFKLRWKMLQYKNREKGYKFSIV